MKMAKATPADIEMAMTLVNYLEAIERQQMPDALSSEVEDFEWLHLDDAAQLSRLLTGLRDLLRKGSILRVVWGMAVVCDPLNECIDPEAATIEHHPKRIQMESALLWALYHAQGGSSPVGQPIRKLLGIGQFDHLTEQQIAQAQAFAQAMKGGA